VKGLRKVGALLSLLDGRNGKRNGLLTRENRCVVVAQKEREGGARLMVQKKAALSKGRSKGEGIIFTSKESRQTGS